MSPPGVSTQTTRLPIHLDLSPAGARRLQTELADAVRLVAAAGTRVVLYACTIGSIIRSHEELSIIARGVVDLPFLTTANSVIEAMRALGMRRIALLSPYTDELNQHEIDFLERSGFHVSRTAGLGITSERFSELAFLGPQDAVRLAREADGTDIDGLFLTCTDFACADAIEEIEKRAQKPVVTSNQASLWAALRAGGVRDTIMGYGRLLRQAPN